VSPIDVRLRDLRKARGLTQVQVAEATGIDQSQISRIESGETTAMDFSVLERLCAVLRCEPGDLLERAGRPRKRRGR
jgi:putative transcriptional regulator